MMCRTLNQTLIEEIMDMARKFFNVAADLNIRLIYAGRMLQKGMSVSNYNIQQESVLHAVFTRQNEDGGSLRMIPCVRQQPCVQQQPCFEEESQPESQPETQPKTFNIPQYYFDVATRAANSAANQYWPNDPLAASPEIVARELLYALVCKASAGPKGDKKVTRECSLPPRLDMVHHNFILETEDYEAFCKEVCGIFLHHTAKTAEDSIETKQARVDLTYVLRNQCYPNTTAPEWCWESEQSINGIVIDSPVAKRTRQGLKRAKVTKAKAKNTQASKVTFNVYVKMLNGKTIDATVTPNMRVEGLRHIIMRNEGIACDHQRIIFAGRNIYDGHLKDYNIKSGACLHLVLKMRGC